MYSKINSMGLAGLDAFTVQVEIDLAKGLPRFDLVGLPDAAVKESRERVRAAIKNCDYKFPVSRIVVNIAPANIKKEGPLYDLPIFMALLKAGEQLKANTDDYVFIGELSLDGSLRHIQGALPMVIGAKENGFKGVFVPKENELECSVVDGIDVFAVSDVHQVIKHLNGEEVLEKAYRPEFAETVQEYPLDFSDVKGQFEVKRAMEIAAAGSHNIILIGSPGSGKSMLAKRLPSILPEMTFDESIETTKIHSVAGELPDNVPLIKQRPFRSPHHTVSSVGLAGGGASIKPGEISLAHNGVLFLDELPEFSRHSLETLRQPIEDGTITISRASGSLTYPCSVMLVCAMNPCPCGFYGHPTKKCTCTDNAAKRYMSKISGPLLDRIDLHVEVQPVDFSELSSDEKGESSAKIRECVNAARAVQSKRFEGMKIHSNAQMSSNDIRRFCIMTDDAKKILAASFERLDLSARAYDKILRVARTIADLDKSENIEMHHIAEAIQYRSLDRKYWNI